MDADICEQASTQVIPGKIIEKKEQRPKASLGIKMGAIATPLIEFAARNWLFILLALSGQKVHPMQIAQVTGSLIGGVLIPTVVVLLFQIGKRFRNPRSRWAIFFYTSLFLLVTHMLSVFAKG